MFFTSSKPKTVAEAIGAFNKVIEDLNTIKEEQEREVARQNQLVIEAQAARDAAAAEAANANGVMFRITSLLTGSGLVTQ